MIALYECINDTNSDIDSEKFGCYAALKIRGAMMNELRKHDFLPRSFRNKLKGDSATEYDKSLEYSGLFDDVDDYHDLDDNSDILADLIKTQDRTIINECFSRCSGKNRNILYLIYNEGLTQREVARKFWLTESRISQLKNKALKELRHKLKDNHG